MNTPAHLLLGAAALGRTGATGTVWAAMIGALLPDLSLYLMAGTALFVMNIPPNVVFDQLYFSDAWQQVFAIDNSFILWAALLGIAVWWRRDWAVALTGAALLHLMFDFLLHHDDGRPHFWPLSDWVFASPVSYWDVRHGAGWVGPIEVLMSVICAGIIWWRRPGVVLSAVTVLLVAAQLMTARVWLFVFTP